MRYDRKIEVGIMVIMVFCIVWPLAVLWYDAVKREMDRDITLIQTAPAKNNKRCYKCHKRWS